MFAERLIGFLVDCFFSVSHKRVGRLHLALVILKIIFITFLTFNVFYLVRIQSDTSLFLWMLLYTFYFLTSKQISNSSNDANLTFSFVFNFWKNFLHWSWQHCLFRFFTRSADKMSMLLLFKQSRKVIFFCFCEWVIKNVTNPRV